MESKIDNDINHLFNLINNNKLEEAAALEKQINEGYSLKELEANKEVFLLLQYKRDKQSIRNTVDKIIALPLPNC